MLTNNNPDSKSEIELSNTSTKQNNRTIFLAIAVIVFLTVIAMTGVYYEYW